MIRVRDLRTVDDVEKALDAALRSLRAIPTGSNTVATSAIEYRIGRLRDSKRDLERAS